jgi:hypothetical protein
MFLPEVGFELREDAKHVEERLLGGATGVDGLLRGFQDCTLRLDRVNDDLLVDKRTRHAVDAGHNQTVAWSAPLRVDRIKHQL